MTKAYVIAHPKVTDMEKFGSDFASKVEATITPFEGKFLVRTPEVLHQEGEKGNFTVIIEFPDKEKAMGWFNSEAHQKIVDHRRKNTDPSTTFVIVEGSTTI